MEKLQSARIAPSSASEVLVNAEWKEARWRLREKRRGKVKEENSIVHSQIDYFDLQRVSDWP
jgi:hypothetical protein